MKDNLQYFVQEAVSRFWDNYINMPVDQEVKKPARRWHVKHVEQYIEQYPDDRLRIHSTQHVVAFFTKIGSEGRLFDWHNGKPSMLYGLPTRRSSSCIRLRCANRTYALFFMLWRL